MEIIWKPIPGWEGHYEASNVGLIKSIERIYFNKDTALLTTTGILKPKMDKDCYLQVCLCKEGERYYYKINQLVAAAFLDNPDKKPFTDHLNGVRWDNRVDNLKWVTQSENIKSSFELGRKVVASKPINQLDADGNFIKRYEAIAHVDKFGFKSRYVNQVVKDKTRKAYGYLWEYADPNQI